MSSEDMLVRALQYANQAPDEVDRNKNIADIAKFIDKIGSCQKVKQLLEFFSGIRRVTVGRELPEIKTDDLGLKNKGKKYTVHTKLYQV